MPASRPHPSPPSSCSYSDLVYHFSLGPPPPQAPCFASLPSPPHPVAAAALLMRISARIVQSLPVAPSTSGWPTLWPGLTQDALPGSSAGPVPTLSPRLGSGGPFFRTPPPAGLASPLIYYGVVTFDFFWPFFPVNQPVMCGGYTEPHWDHLTPSVPSTVPETRPRICAGEWLVGEH